MVSAVRSFVKALLVSALFVCSFAGASVAAESGAKASADAVSSAEAELVAELAVRDSVMAVRDSACTVEKQSLRSDLEIEKAKCENWEQSYNALKKNNETCAKALGIAMEASQEQAEKDFPFLHKKRSCFFHSKISSRFSFTAGVSLYPLDRVLHSQ